MLLSSQRGPGGIPEILDDDCALFVPVKDSKETAQQILKLAQSPPLRQEIAERAARRVLPKVAPERFGREVRANLHEVLHSK